MFFSQKLKAEGAANKAPSIGQKISVGGLCWLPNILNVVYLYIYSLKL